MLNEAHRSNDYDAIHLCGAQVFGFSVRQADQYAHYDWDQLTTVAWNTDPALMCMVRTAQCHPRRVLKSMLKSITGEQIQMQAHIEGIACVLDNCWGD
jgi:glutamine synthetase